MTTYIYHSSYHSKDGLQRRHIFKEVRQSSDWPLYEKFLIVKVFDIFKTDRITGNRSGLSTAPATFKFWAGTSIDDVIARWSTTKIEKCFLTLADKSTIKTLKKEVFNDEFANVSIHFSE